MNGMSAIAAFRVAQEALTNVVRHSGATGVELRLSSQNGSLELVVEDNGHGFDPAALSEQQSLGITGMRERAALAGGELEITSRPGGGCRVRLVLPLAEFGGEAL